MSGATRGFRWHGRGVDLQLLISPFLPRLPAGRAVTAAHALIWRFRATEPIDVPTFDCEWDEDAKWSDWDFANGELLAAIEWSDTSIILHVGTGDADYYAGLAGRVPWIPARWLEVFKGGRDGYDRHPGQWDQFELERPPNDDALRRARIVLPRVCADELCQVHFLIAWTDRSEDPLDVSSWLAVEQDASVFMPSEVDSSVA